jgi:hypothetical protein
VPWKSFRAAASLGLMSMGSALLRRLIRWNIMAITPRFSWTRLRKRANCRGLPSNTLRSTLMWPPPISTAGLRLDLANAA